MVTTMTTKKRSLADLCERSSSKAVDDPPLQWGSYRKLRFQLPNVIKNKTTTMTTEEEEEKAMVVPPPPTQIQSHSHHHPHQEEAAATPSPSKLVIRIRYSSSSAAAVEVPPPLLTERQWNLRPRDHPRAPPPPTTRKTAKEEAKAKSKVAVPTLPSTMENAATEQVERRKRSLSKMQQQQASTFRLTLTREDVDADYIAITGGKAPRKPKRRPKPIQNEVDFKYPGSLLPKTITPDRYR